MTDIQEGATATHRDGRRIVYRGGAWHVAPNPASAEANPDAARNRMRAGEPVMDPSQDPFRNIQGRAHDQARVGQLNQASRYISTQQPLVDNARTTLSGLDEFEALNNRTRNPGGVVNRTANWVRSSLGDADLNRMDQLSNSMARHMRQPGEGAVSDYEGRLFQQMVGGYNQPFQTNRQYIAAARRLAQRQIEQQQFRENYVAANGTLIGSDSLWGRYRDANPILDRQGRVRTPVPFSRWQASLRDTRDVDEAVARRRAPGTPAAPPSARRPAQGGWSITRVP